ncbi:PepSY-associated TM helix domain-containing protein [Falsirhodobacter algicola]|uniref:PepSY domain-containing protein n=1 Tax=Falsirhodobacter algicola TaxID=2692330 RepID=A0A8J8MVY2_9RHOB|nr:PepSY-associated TM helix domain-containing protein [Falsirhodobacter algicola]QUS37283.1 PepSY domain-containing protein [Falsirhodobacter algicola]
MSHSVSAGPGALRALLLRLHFYAGLFIGPFLFVAALTGLLYVATPQLEAFLYRGALTTDSSGPARSLTDQAEAARAYLDTPLAVSAVRPAPGPGQTTRILFSDPALGASQNRTVFVDPVTLAIRGDLTTYGTSGVLPLRIFLDDLHRNLHLGDWGRYYSELAASWLWLVTLGGVALWATAPKRTQALRAMPPAQRRRWIHGTLGVSLAVVLIFVSATGLTWSQAAGGRIDMLRQAMGWTTPSVSLAAGAAGGEHALHHAQDPALREDRLDQLDAAAAAAKAGGIDSPRFEIRLPRPGQAWMVREYDRRWPSQVDTVALDPATLAVTDRAMFASFGPVAKMIRWGIDMHMGILFGLPNQMLMAAVASGLLVMIVLGYRMWWARRPVAAPMPLIPAILALPALGRLAALAFALALGWALPVLGISLALFLLIDILRWARTPRAIIPQGEL